MKNRLLQLAYLTRQLQSTLDLLSKELTFLISEDKETPLKKTGTESSSLVLSLSKQIHMQKGCAPKSYIQQALYLAPASFR